MHRQAHALAQFLGEAQHFLRLDSLFPTHPQRKADHDFCHLIIAHQPGKLLEIQPLILTLQRLQALRGDSQRVRDSDTNSLGPHIQSENPPQRRRGYVCGFRTHVCDYMLLRSVENSTTIAGMSGEELGIAPEPVRTPSRDWALRIIAIGVVLTICYVAELVLVVILVATLVAFILAPIVDFLGRFRAPRGLSSLIAVFILLGLMYGISYASYNEAANF